MTQTFTELLTSPAGIACLVIALILGFPLLKIIIWKLFSFDTKVDQILFQKKSSEVRTGKLVETLAPIMESFPVDISKPGTSTVFLGQPVDYIHFDPEEGITFIEVKSGGAKLKSNQKRIMEQIEAGNIFWASVNIKGE